MRARVLLALIVLLAFATPAVHGAAATIDPSTVKPKIVWKKIEFNARRKRETARYSLEHYGKRTYVLSNPHVIIEHYTDSTTFSSAWNYMNANVKHLGEFPGVCSHFLIDKDGTIYQLVNLNLRCRHAVGMNWTSIGIEHVGTSDRQILHNHRMMRASLHLTAWLMAKYGISWGNVIGHAEALNSPYHREKVRSWRCLVHSDWLRRDMRKYRRRLKVVLRHEGIPLGSKPDWQPSGC